MDLQGHTHNSWSLPTRMQQVSIMLHPSSQSVESVQTGPLWWHLEPSVHASPPVAQQISLSLDPCFKIIHKIINKSVFI